MKAVQASGGIDLHRQTAVDLAVCTTWNAAVHHLALLKRIVVRSRTARHEDSVTLWFADRSEVVVPPTIDFLLLHSNLWITLCDLLLCQWHRVRVYGRIPLLDQPRYYS